MANDPMITLRQAVDHLLSIVDGSKNTVCVCDSVLPRADRHRCGGLADDIKGLQAAIQDIQKRLNRIDPPLTILKDYDW